MEINLLMKKEDKKICVCDFMEKKYVIHNVEKEDQFCYYYDGNKAIAKKNFFVREVCETEIEELKKYPNKYRVA